MIRPESSQAKAPSCFPRGTVTAGLTFRIQLWESKKSQRDFGQTMKAVSAAVTDSDLTRLLAPLAMATGAPGTAITAIAAAGVTLAGLIGRILENRGDDYADFFEGYYSASELWRKGQERNRGQHSEIVLTRMT